MRRKRSKIKDNSGSPFWLRLYKPAMPAAKYIISGVLLLLVLCISALDIWGGIVYVLRASALHTFSTNVPNKSIRPIALVYRGPAGCEGCSESVRNLLASSRWGFDVKYVGPNELLSVAQGLQMPNVQIYAQPGGEGTLEQAYQFLHADAPAMRKFIQNGGHYLGFCMGGYFAGSDPGFNILPGDSDQFIIQPGASVTKEADTIIQVRWRDHLLWMYFQDGPIFILNPDVSNVTVLAKYTNGDIASLVAPYGKGSVGVVGPHPEADANWYNAYNLKNPEGIHFNPGFDLIDTTMTTHGQSH